MKSAVCRQRTHVRPTSLSPTQPHPSHFPQGIAAASAEFLAATGRHSILDVRAFAEISALDSDLDALCDAGLIQRFRDDRGVEYFRLVEGVVPE
jgi:hypothetical protein